jgi:hypothetical protein
MSQDVPNKMSKHVLITGDESSSANFPPKRGTGMRPLKKRNE